ncbi:MAG: TfoX/Sxy family protein [Flavobacteriales bacterium]|nr:TfoX/Sxy family protein [Flavobacteriales bacterium]
MATRKHTALFILDRLGRPERFDVRPMFGEFALYADGKVVGLICDDQLYVKVLPESRSLERTCERAAPFPGAKDYYLVPEGGITGDRTLPDLLIRMSALLPYPKAKRTKRR